MNILAFAASNSRSSINQQIIAHAARLLEAGLIAGAKVNIIDLNDFDVPIYSIDREQATGIPGLAQALYASIGAADALIIAYAEHNGLYTAAYKNLSDWMSRIDIKIYQGKPIVMLAASPGPGGAQRVLTLATESAEHFGAELQASLSIPRFYDNFDTEAGCMTELVLQADLRQALQALAP